MDPGVWGTVRITGPSREARRERRPAPRPIPLHVRSWDGWGGRRDPATAYHPAERGGPGFEPMRRVACPLMADLAKNGPRRPGTPDRWLSCGNLGDDWKGTRGHPG